MRAVSGVAVVGTVAEAVSGVAVVGTVAGAVSGVAVAEEIVVVWFVAYSAAAV